MSLNLRIVFTALATLMALAGQLNAVDLLYVRQGNSVFTYDISLMSATAVSNSKQTLFTGGIGTYGDLSIDNLGNIFVADTYGNKINKFSASGTLLNSIDTRTNITSPRYLAFDNTGNLLASDGRIAKYDSNGAFQSYAGNITGVYGMILHSNGYLYSADPSSNSVKIYNSNYLMMGSIGSSTNLSSPRQPAFDSSGNIYVANYNSRNISKFDSSGVFQNYIGSNLTYIESLGVGSDGYIYASGSGLINKFDTSGNLIFSWNNPGSGTPFLAFAPTAVPEPSTYALGLIASGALAAIAKRRKSRKITIA